ncbi:hypothetical protein N4G70_31985 [Streptomyces sp. ASQP_92]|uniref:hypothetical protein n=1 Tax=Streptomyces sp. ASQP_92 TaxID=2979116 RepID=UPI0021C219F1|nr:hypothetical protein [Streptomyces sp. ASQP_92]MCT9093455.1 hypothetical protein [Streptomyces sp. ASQP_92]
MKVTAQHVGTCVAWNIRSGATVIVRLTGFGPDGVSYTCTDGFREYQPTSFAISLDDITGRWRPATAEETAEFERLYRPAPENWD